MLNAAAVPGQERDGIKMAQTTNRNFILDTFVTKIDEYQPLWRSDVH